MTMSLSYKKEFAFNAICPYYTMFPLEYPLRIIRQHRQSQGIILDPFCGRGTTIYAARKCGLSAYGFDTSPIAAAIARAKLASATLDEVIRLGDALLAKPPKTVPHTAFFRRAFSRRTLVELCSLAGSGGMNIRRKRRRPNEQRRRMGWHS
jgi:DNA methylase